MTSRFITLLAAVALAAGFAVPANAQKPGPTAPAGAVYTQTNNVDRNYVIAYSRASNGTLSRIGAFDTRGRGSGGTIDPLQSQGSVLLSPDHQLLFVTNSGSGTVSCFIVGRDGSLSLADREPSGGGFPVALAEYQDLLYVLNSGGAGSISGFWVRAGGRLEPIVGSTQLLSAASAGGSSIGFTPDGGALVVTERLTNKIDVFPIDSNGAAGALTSYPSHGATPFAVSITPQGTIVVAEAAGGPSGGAAISSYALTPASGLTVISGSVPTGYNAACWLVATANGQFAFAANAGSGEISEIGIAGSGALSILGAASSGSGSTPLDLALTADDHFLYALTAGDGAITGFSVGSGGSLTSIGSVAAQPAASGQNGLAAY